MWEGVWEGMWEVWGVGASDVGGVGECVCEWEREFVERARDLHPCKELVTTMGEEREATDGCARRAGDEIGGEHRASTEGQSTDG